MKAENRRLLGHLQNLCIVALTLSAVFLLMQTPLVGDLAGKTPYELMQRWMDDDPAGESIVSADLTELALPVSLVFTNEYARYGLDALTTLDADFDQAGALFREALASADTLASCREETLLDALRGSGIYLDLSADTPLSLLCSILGAPQVDSELHAVSRLLLCPTEDGNVTLYLQDRALGAFSCSTSLSSTALSESLAALDGNGTDFAFSLSGDYASLSPYTLIFSEASTRYTLSAASGLTDRSTFLRLAEFNPHTSGYTDSSGTTVIQEVYGTLRISADGSVSYQGDNAESGSLYYISCADAGHPTLSEAVSGAQKLAFTLLRDFCGDASLYLSGISGSGKNYTVTFDYSVGGTPLRFSDGAHAASVTIEGSVITAFSLRCRNYSLSDSPALLLPATQAAAIAGLRYPGAELHVCYEDRGGDSAGLNWFAD